MTRIGARIAYLALLFLFFGAANVMAQKGWVRERPVIDLNDPTLNPMNAVVVMNDSVVLLAAGHGAVLRSQDTGTTFRAIGPFTDLSIEFLQRLSAYECLAFADSGMIFQSTDMGRSWNPAWIHKWDQLLSVSFCDSIHGMMAYSYEGMDSILSTSDGGLTWGIVTLPNSLTPAVVCQISAHDLFICTDNGGASVSHDGGMNWVTTNAHMAEIKDAKFLDTSIGFLAGYGGNDGVIVRTSDGGATWNTVFDDSLPGTLLKIAFVSKTTAVVVGTEGKMCRTTDQGLTWTELPKIDYDEFPDVSFSSNGFGYSIDFYAGTLFSHDSGATWRNIDLFNERDNVKINFSDSLHGGFLTDAPNLYLTSDGGNEWYCPLSSRAYLQDFVRIGDSVIIAVGQGYNGTVFRSTNSGDSWTERRGVDSLLSVARFENGTLYIAGPNRLLISPDSGLTWSSDTLSSGFIVDLSFSTPIIGALVDANGRLWQTHDRAHTWTVDSKAPVNLQKLQMMDDSTLLVLSGMSLQRSTDSGRTWKQLMDGGTTFQFCDPRNGMCVGQNGRITRTTDGGLTWHAEQSGYYNEPVSRDFYSVQMLDSLNAFAVGDNGVLINTRNGGFLPSVNVVAKTYDFGTVPLGSKRDTVITLSNSSSDTIVLSQQSLNSPVQAVLSDSLLLPMSLVFDTVKFQPPDTLQFYGRIVLNHNNLFEDTLVILGKGKKLSGSVSISEDIGERIQLSAIPNPFTSQTSIAIFNPRQCQADVYIVNLLGSQVARLFTGELAAGEPSFVWDAGNLPPGMYECVVNAGGHIQRIQVVHVR